MSKKRKAQRKRWLNPSRRTRQTRREQSRPGSTNMRKQWPALLAKSVRRYTTRIALSFHPDLHVMWRRDELISRLLLSETRVRALRVAVERRLRAAGLLV